MLFRSIVLSSTIFYKHIIRNMKVFSTVKVERAPKPHVQVRDQIRELIISGKLKPGTKLPPTKALAGTCGTTITTLHRALSALTQEGLLIRERRMGTFVRGRSQKLDSVGLYLPCDPWSVPEFGAKRAVMAALRELTTSREIKLSTWFDPRPFEQQNEPWPELVSAIHREHIEIGRAHV